MPHPFSYATVETLTGARTITTAEAEETTLWSLDPGGAGRTVTLPAEADCAGLVLFVSNEADGAEILTIEDDGSNTIVTPTQNEAAILWCDGVSWFGLVGASA